MYIYIYIKIYVAGSEDFPSKRNPIRGSVTLGNPKQTDGFDTYMHAYACHAVYACISKRMHG